MGPWNGCPKYDLGFVANACYQGDLDMLEMLLFTGDSENKFPGDINTHITEMTPLMYAAQNGQIEAVQLMLKAKADPHMKCRCSKGTDPKDGEDALQIAKKNGYSDVVALLEKEVKVMPPGRYQRYGAGNNSCLAMYETGETGRGKNPFAAVKVVGYVPGAKKVKAVGPPPTTIALLFPGQGSQYVKMLTSVADLVEVKELVAEAKAVLGYDILDICLNGPEEQLGETKVCQPAMFLAGAAGLIKLKETRPEAVQRPAAVAGLSLGEYTALYAAGVLSFRDALELVKVRAEAMSDAAKFPPQAMLSVAGLTMEVLENLCKAQSKDDEVCEIANVLFPKGFSCSGSKSAIEKLQKAAEATPDALQVKMLKTSGAFHTRLMQPAQVKLEEALKQALPKMKPPTCDVYMNVTGKKIKAGTPPDAFVELLSQQLCNRVLWEPSVRLMIRDGITEFYEVGPMKQLKAMMKRIDQSHWESTVNVDI